LADSEPDPGREPVRHPLSVGTAVLVSTLLSAPGSSLATLLVIAGGCLLLAFFFALFESALQHYSRLRVSGEAKKRGITEAIDGVLLKEDEILFASKVGRALAQSIGIATLVLAILEVGPDGVAPLLWAILIASIFLLLNVSGPYVLGRRFGDAIVLRWLVSYSRAIVPLQPLSNLLQRLASRVMGAQTETDPAEEIKDEILSAAEEGTREGTMEHTEKRMIEGVIDLHDVTADHIMTPRTDLVCLPIESTATEAIEKTRERGLSRVPVYRETPDDITGVLYTKDLLPHIGKPEIPPIESLLHKPFFIPQSKNVGDLLQEMRKKRKHMAIVLDEYGGTAGVVTIEDILEEIVGEIEDEHEAAVAQDVVRINANVATVEGRTHIDDLNRTLDLEVPESEEYETVGGLIFSSLGRVPSTGEHFDLNGVRFTILEADQRRINRVKVSSLKKTS